MDRASLERRLRVILVTTRAAARSLRDDDHQAEAAIRRGLTLLDELEPDVRDRGDDSVADQLAAGRTELSELLERRAT